MDVGLYSCFQDWKLECELILWGTHRNRRALESQHTHSMGLIIWFKKPQGVAEG